MSLATYADLKTAVANWTHRADLTPYLDDLILHAERHIFRRVRARSMETDLSGTIGATGLAVPTGFLELKFAYITGTPVKWLDIKPAASLIQTYANRSDSGKPSAIAVNGANFIFGPAGSGYAVGGTYYARPAAISTSVNALFTENPDLYLFAALAETMAYVVNDDRVALWIAKRDEIIAQINEESRASHWGDAMAVSVV